MRECVWCGAEIQSGTTVCNKCGSDIGDQPETPKRSYATASTPVLDKKKTKKR